MEHIDIFVKYMNTQDQQSHFVVDIQNNCPPDYDSIVPDSRSLEGWVCAVFDHEKLIAAELTLRLVDEQEIQALNQQYRQKNYPTNVLSFPSEIPAEILLDPPLLGDIILCAPVIQREAEEQNKPLMSHWAHMVVHGVLHLLGYDHVQDHDADRMEQIEIMILENCGVANPYHNNEE